jgi:hypothetical protein
MLLSNHERANFPLFQNVCSVSIDVQCTMLKGRFGIRYLCVLFVGDGSKYRPRQGRRGKLEIQLK